MFGQLIVIFAPIKQKMGSKPSVLSLSNESIKSAHRNPGKLHLKDLFQQIAFCVKEQLLNGADPFKGKESIWTTKKTLVG